MKKIFNMTPVKMSIGNVQPYDTILCSDGLWRTVCQNDIKTAGIMGTRIHRERGVVSVLRPTK